MPDDFSKFEALKSAGASADDIYRVAMQDGIDQITRIRLIRAVFGLSLRDAKEVWARVEENAESLDEYQGRWTKVVQDALELHKAASHVPRA